MGGFSKAYAMTGWRVGYVAGPGRRSSRGWSRSTSTGSCRRRRPPRTPRSPRSIEGEADVARMLAEYDRRRRLLVDGLNALGLETFEPRGAFYAFPRIGSTGLDDETFAERLLTEERVAVVPGSAFGPSGAGHVRMCYATSYERLEEALRRIGRFVARAPGCDAGRGLRSGPRRFSGLARSSLQCFLDRPDRQRPNVHARPEVPGRVVCLGRPEPEATLVGDGRRAARRRPAFIDQTATDHERRERVGRPDPHLGRLLARCVDRAVGAHPVDRAHPPAGEAARRCVR